VIDVSVGWSALLGKMAFTPQGVPTQDLVSPFRGVVRESVNRFKKTAQIRRAKKRVRNDRNSNFESREVIWTTATNLSQELSDALGYTRGRGLNYAVERTAQQTKQELSAEWRFIAWANRTFLVRQVRNYCDRRRAAQPWNS